MGNELHRHDISDKAWSIIEPYTIGNKGTWGGNARDTRLFINAVFWILHTGAPWRDLPAEYGDWKNTHRRFCRWRDKRIWEKMLETLIDATHVKVHPHAAGAVGGNQDMGKTKGVNTDLKLKTMQISSRKTHISELLLLFI